MAAAMPITTLDSMTAAKNSTLKTFSLLWLDIDKARISSYVDARKKLRSTIDSIETFEQIDACEHFVQLATDQNHHVIIVGMDSAEEFIPRLHHYDQIISIYVYKIEQIDKEINWKMSYPKVKKIFENLEDFLTQITVDRKRYHEIGQPLTFSMFHIRNDVQRSSLNINGNFLHLQLLIELLLRLKSTESDHKKFLDLCRREYAGKDTIALIIDEFEKDYKPELAVRWYTRETFIYQRLNEALRLQDINWLFHYRFFIRDVYETLRDLQQKELTISVSNVYRNQLMSLDEVMHLKNSIGALISFTSFLSTSQDRQKRMALFGEDPTVFTDSRPVLFEINLSPPMNRNKLVFADITGMSAFGEDENETLFMVGSIFRLEESYMDTFVTVFKLSPCSETDLSDFKDLVEKMKNDIGIGTDDTLLTLGNLLWKSGRCDQAEEFYYRMLDELSSNDHLIPNCYQGLGLVAAARGNFNEALRLQRKVLQYYQEQSLEDDYRLGVVWNSLGNVHWRTKNYPLALEAYNKAKAVFHSHHDRDLASCLNNMGNVYEETDELDQALEHHQQALNIRESILPPNHSELATSHHNIANVYHRLNQSDRARTHIKQARKIFEKSLRPNDPSIASTYQSMAVLEFDRGAYRQGLRYLEQAAGIFRETLPADHPTLERIHSDIAQVMMAMGTAGFNYL